MKDILFKSEPIGIIIEDGFIKWTKLKLATEIIYKENYTGADKSIIAFVIANCQEIIQEVGKIKKQAEIYQNSINQKSLF